jgi:hypothetical protein
MMPLFGRDKRKIPCKFCSKDAIFVKEYNEYFCSDCNRFQLGTGKEDIKLLPVLKLKHYKFSAQKLAYIVYDQLGTKIAYCERRDISRYTDDKQFGIRYLFFNNTDRMIASVDGYAVRSFKEIDSEWRVFDYGRHLRGIIINEAETDNWKIVDTNNEQIALREPEEAKSDFTAMRSFTFIDSVEDKNKLFSVQKKGGAFYIDILVETIDPHFAWAFIIALHRKYYLS